MAWKRESRWFPLIVLVLSTGLFFFGTGFSPIGLLAWLAPLPVLFVATRVSGWTAAGVAFGAWLLGSSSTWGYFFNSVDVPLPLGIFILVFIAALFAGAVALYRAMIRAGRPILAVLAPGALWAGAFFLIGKASPVGVILPLATSQADLPVVLRLASLTGGVGIEFLVLVTACGVAAVPAVHKGRALTAAVTGVLLVAALGYGIARPAAGEGEKRTVALVGRDIAPWAPDVATPEGRENVAAFAARIAELPDGVDIAILPEGVFGAHMEDLAALVDPLRTVATAKKIDIIGGLSLREGDRKYNTSIAIPADGGTPVIYRMWHADGPNTSGTELTWLPADDRVAIAICRDVNFPDPAADYALAGANTILLSGRDQEPIGRQHAITAVIRGVEHGMSVAWAADQGHLILADAHGRILAETPTDGDGFTVIQGELPEGPGATLYTRFGDWFAWACAAFAAVCLGLLVMRGIRGRRTRTPGAPAVTE